MSDEYQGEFNDEIAGEILLSLLDGDLDKACELLRKHPECLHENGKDRWLNIAVRQDWLEGVQALVECGADINATVSPEIEGVQYEPEGCIEWASTVGATEIVQWLLENGAKINFDVLGNNRCYSLLSAVENGHFDIVKLLVEHGAVIHGTGHGDDVNPTTLAEQCKEFEIRDYLISKGGVDFRETVPIDYSTGHRLIDEHVIHTKGQILEGERTIDGMSPPVVIKAVDQSYWSALTIYTNGLSDRRRPKGQEQYFCSELLISLPNKTPVDSPLFNWAVAELTRLATLLDSRSTWFSDLLFPLNRWDDDCRFINWYLCKRDMAVICPDYRVINMHELVPFLPDEVDYVTHFEGALDIQHLLYEIRDELFSSDRAMIEFEHA